jgi:PAS domain S-box-containing protein
MSLVRLNLAMSLVFLLVLCSEVHSAQASPPANALPSPSRRILILYDVNASYPAIRTIDDAIRESLLGSKYHVEIYREYLETALFPDDTDQKLFREFYVRKYHDRKLDVIITVGSSSLRFMAEQHRKYFPGIPIVFCLPNGEENDLKPDLEITGVRMGIEADKTLEAALQLLPHTRHVLVVGGAGTFERQTVEEVKEQLSAFSSRVDLTYATDLAMPELLKRLRGLPQDYIVLFTSMGRDSAGTYYSSRESGPLIGSASSVPVFTLFDVYLGHGEVGGSLSKISSQGTNAGNAARKILDGVSPSDIPVADATKSFVFDWRALNRWGLDQSKLPPGSIVLNRPPSPWLIYRWYIIGGISLVLIEALLISGLLLQHRRARRAEATVRESEERFRLLANTAPVLIWTSGIDKLCNYVNRPWLEFTGMTLEEEIGDTWTKGIHPEDVRLALDTYTSAFDRRQPFEIQYRLRRHDGEYRWMFDRGVPRFNADNSFAGYIDSCTDITETKLAEEALTNLSGQLIIAQEEERRRVAREIHDDYQQRLAMVAYNLDVMRRHIADSPAETEKRLDHLGNEINELAADLHSLSHRLHSSTLESLGLVVGLSGFCKEFQNQNGLEIKFIHENVPRGLPADLALCLFRVAQEGLRNVKKHSGTKYAEVRLESKDEKLYLIVSDRGSGFDPNFRSAASGIGIRSMQERLRLVGGSLEIHSRQSEGTTISAWVPLSVTHLAASNS